ncbi:tetratricopeptide repeat protein [Variovorax sp. J22R133]|uniref:tetratricopeptide repeat protein n=1 Tax=Variovorax brevis TaxID=3053503 RepID=UPI0025777336|nr:tetratricopeptide repeat protein [Variovorax sp. J22R133]MDM0117235.1 tetratricopeptide repeat protein [Variovorax sp. J22R133]
MPRTAHRYTPPPPAQLGLPQALALAVKLHRAGNLDDAETLYKRILAAAPGNADALHFMGVLTHQRGRSEQALGFIQKSLALAPTVPDWHNNLGNVLLAMGRIDEAAQSYEEAARLGPDRADVLNNLGVLRREQNRLEESEAAYRRALELDAKNVDTFTNLGSLLNSMGRGDEALRAFCEALVLKPRHGRARQALGMAYYTLKRFDEAAQVYSDWLKDEPNSPEARHHLAACSGKGVPERAADDYVETVFDGFADSFDAKLAILHYRAPELIAQTVASLIGEPRKDLSVLDAGCGTGLCGPFLAPYAKRLLGVDLSARMLAKAEPRQVYDGLAKAELTAFIEGEQAQSYDLIISADTLCYFGDLRAVTRAAARAMRPGAWLVFTVESIVHEEGQPAHEDFHLNPHGRYSHREGYLRSVLADAGLDVHDAQAVHLRMEGGKPVDGYVVSARAPVAQGASA